MRVKEFIKKYIPVSVIVVFIIAIIVFILSLIAPSSYALSDFINRFISTPLRAAMSYLTYLLPFSLFEIILIALLPSLVALIILAIADKSDSVVRVRRVLSAFGVVLALLSGYLLIMSIPYNTTPISEELGIKEREELTADELYRAAEIALDEVNRLSPLVLREGDISYMPYDFDELSQLISAEYGRVAEQTPFFSNFHTRMKPVMFSGIMSDMGISGIYTYFTGESNVNVEYPDYDVAFTVAHEFAHQRGINRENEANFMAFFVLSRSDDVFLRYSAYLNIYQYLASALNRADREAYLSLAAELSPMARADIRLSSSITAAHRESPLFEIMTNVNDAYLQSNGTAGVVSYGYVVRIAVAYLLD